MYAASWAHTTASARAQRPDKAALVQAPQTPSLTELPATRGSAPPSRHRWVGPFVGGAAAMLGAIAAFRKRNRA
jgi:hypothetical protein